MKDEYATERAAFHAGATIQAFTTGLNDGHLSLKETMGTSGYWRDLDVEPKFSCHPTRYRVKP